MLSTVGIPSSTLLKAVMAVIETSQKKGILSKLGLSLCGKFLTLFCAVQVNSRFYPRKGDPKVWPFKWKVMNSTFLWYCLFICTKRFICLSPFRMNHEVWPEMKAIEHFLSVAKVSVLTGILKRERACGHRFIFQCFRKRIVGTFQIFTLIGVYFTLC